MRETVRMLQYDGTSSNVAVPVRTTSGTLYYSSTSKQVQTHFLFCYKDGVSLECKFCTGTVQSSPVQFRNSVLRWITVLRTYIKTNVKDLYFIVSDSRTFLFCPTF